MSELPPLAMIGGGNMGSAICAGLDRLDQPPVVTVIDPSADIRQRHADAGRRVADSPDAVSTAKVVILAVKPQMVEQVAEGLAPHLGPEHTLISILAGTTTATLSRCFPTAGAVVRAMPNTPMAAGLGMVGIAPGPGADADTMDLAETVFAPSAKVLRCTEDRIDALTAVSGSGPAYCFLFAEAMMAGAQALGFSADEAQLLVGQTLRGSIAYLDGQEGYPAAQLRSQVTSPGGTTAAALSVFADADFTGLVERALVAARNRGQELAG